MQIKIYDIVRRQLESSFLIVLQSYLSMADSKEINHAGFVAYSLQNHNSRVRPMVWG